MLGVNYAGAIIHSGEPYTDISVNNGTFKISNLNCVGTEDDITECPSDKWGDDVYCSNKEPLEIECNTPISLESGSNENIGYVYVHSNDTYKKICGDNFTLTDADVVCRKIGIETNKNATIYYGNKFTSGRNYIKDLQCNGDEADLQDCKSLPWDMISTSCNKSNSAVSVNCRPHTPIRINTSRNGLVETAGERFVSTTLISRMPVFFVTCLDLKLGKLIIFDKVKITMQ